MKLKIEREKSIIELVQEHFFELNKLKKQRFKYKELHKIFCAETGRDVEFMTFRDYFLKIRRSNDSNNK